MRKEGWNVLAFLDDFAGVEESEQKALQSYAYFNTLTKELGLSLALDKCEAPSQIIEWLGYEVDVNNMMVTIPPTKMDQVLDECERWRTRKIASKTMIQSLVGKLIHVANCVKHARKFVARILSTLRYMASANRPWTTLTPDFLADVLWFENYASQGNGRSLIDPPCKEILIECDSSLRAGGGNSEDQYYTWIYSNDHMKNYTQIHHLEAINLMVAYRTLCPPITQGYRIVMITDNMASSIALATG